MTLASRPAVVILSQASHALGRKIANAIDGDLHGASARTSEVDFAFDEAKAHLSYLFSTGRPIVAVMASGALIRILAPLLTDKFFEPAVVAVSDDGASVVPLLGGHRGGNDLARKIAAVLDGHAAVTTAGDLRFGVALDQPPRGYVLANPENAKAVMAELVAGASARLIGQASWLSNTRIPFAADGTVTLTVTDRPRTAAPLELVYHPKTLVLGMGCERHASTEEAIELARTALADSGLARESLSCVASIDVKADETAIHAVAGHFGVPARFFSAARLEEEAPRLKNPSDIVFAEVGCHGVAEGAALAGASPSGDLVFPKIKSKGATAAIACGPAPVDPDTVGRARGKLFVVGIGPGADQWRSPEVSTMVAASTDLVGYSLYLDLLGTLADGKIRHDFDLGKEEARVVHAMELAGEGKSVALVCSGDAGIYAMATLVFELFDKGGISDAASRIEVQVSPGISALQAAAARIGAPLGHDFCTISLSDLLTPWEHIQRRVKAAGEGDFVIAFYNPVSMKRRTQLAYARDKLLEYRPATTPVILATNLGRLGEHVRTVPLGELNVDDVDMLTVVVVGSSESRTVVTGDGKSWVYTPRGYSGKSDTGMSKEVSQ
ncbi:MULTISPECIES: precorrin-3B C(17)-methyltransferase [Alphaproteobacteria]|uniref:Precorrin-3 methylase CobJ n=2 Tax=Alphaproteobacteria TaxID=28211 RepID=A0A512HI03_9HYPH|nr:MULTISPECIES: precorrin-3B C(17)-methyltransferase [Alphaproteobacteria]GEO85010.1 precorrin-3 methylase CobJ [Ciceribacter naphthalenivorans]GLR22944.1 precorrin-3 methylase CobJ [Ciceribacter naphthalenivorans]GLT05800.1 precorrin-3 methylase CobJ [Sphingomonas psychrolutea]